jgi:hypothetical protein
MISEPSREKVRVIHELESRLHARAASVDERGPTKSSVADTYL